MEYLEQHWQDIAKEAGRIQEIVPISTEVRTPEDGNYDLNGDITKHWIRGWTGDPGWLNFGIIYIGQLIPYAQKECPNTTIALKKLSKEHPITMAGFSWLKPKTGIPPHTDKTPGKMTYHLGLNVPILNLVNVK